jgi:hypothetical protein
MPSPPFHIHLAEAPPQSAAKESTSRGSGPANRQRAPRDSAGAQRPRGNRCRGQRRRSRSRQSEISEPWVDPCCRANALVQQRARYHHCGEAASEKCLSAATFVRHHAARTAASSPKPVWISRLTSTSCCSDSRRFGRNTAWSLETKKRKNSFVSDTLISDGHSSSPVCMAPLTASPQSATPTLCWPLTEGPVRN